MADGKNAQAHDVLLDLFNNVEPTPDQIELTARAASAAGDLGDAYYYMGEYQIADGNLPLAARAVPTRPRHSAPDQRAAQARSARACGKCATTWRARASSARANEPRARRGRPGGAVADRRQRRGPAPGRVAATMPARNSARNSHANKNPPGDAPDRHPLAPRPRSPRLRHRAAVGAQPARPLAADEPRASSSSTTPSTAPSPSRSPEPTCACCRTPCAPASRNFFNNVTYPDVIVNALLQGQSKPFARDTGRFVVNTTSASGACSTRPRGWAWTLEDRDFGQTFGKWGIPVRAVRRTAIPRALGYA